MTSLADLLQNQISTQIIVFIVYNSQINLCSIISIGIFFIYFNGSFISNANKKSNNHAYTLAMVYGPLQMPAFDIWSGLSGSIKNN